MPRIASCGMCLKIERIPDPPPGVAWIDAHYSWEEDGRIVTHFLEDDEGNHVKVAEYDPIMEDFVGRHGHGRDDIEVMNFIKTFACDQKTWDSMDVVSETKKELHKATGEFYEESQHYREEALKCYNAHGNPTMEKKCPDFRNDSKRIGMAYKNPSKQMYLCHMCPYMQTHIAQEARYKAGLYKPESVGRIRSNKARRRR